jgi:hypothetical protein
MRTRVWWLIGLMAALLGSACAQTLVLTNGDVNGDNGVDDADLLSVLFAMGQSCPADCPEDLNGDGVVDDADLLTVLFNMGAQGAPEFAGQPNESSGGAFGISLTVRLADWVGTARQVKVQLKPVGTENDPNVPIFQFRALVGGTDTVVRLDNLPAGVYTVRAFPESPGRWLRVEGKLLTEVPWIFAAPTGANKVTVYWDEVPGATGYRVRWGTTSGSYPNSSAVLPATARQYTVSGLLRDREYYFVVEAAYNGLWGPPSEEDSAVPHEGAIRWDSGNVSWIMEDVRRVTGSTAGRDMLDVLGPDGLIYSDSGVRHPTTFFDVSRLVFTLKDFPSFEIPVTNAGREELENTCTGPYRRVRARGDQNITAVRATFWIPSTFSPRFPYTQIFIPSEVDNPDNPRRPADTPYMYFGFAFSGLDVEGGLMYHRAGRGDLNYPRWQAYLKVVSRGRDRHPAITDTLNERGHILDNTEGGTPTRVELYTIGQERLVGLRVQPIDPVFGEEIFLREIAATAKLKRDMSGLRFRRVFSIAQRKEAMIGCLTGYLRTGSYVRGMAVGYNPVAGIGEDPFLEPPAQVGIGGLFWFDWSDYYTDQAGAYPPPSFGIVSWSEIVRFSREVVSISL